MKTPSKRRVRVSAIFCGAAFIACLVVALLAGIAEGPGRAQVITGCPMQEPEVKGWARNTEVTYAFFVNPGASFSDDALRQMRAAFSEWDAVNQGNCMLVRFREDHGNQDANIKVVARSSDGISTEIGVNPVTKITIQQDIRINVTLPILASHPDTYKKAILHEIGHSMGLDDMPLPQTAGKSVMNGGHGSEGVRRFV